MSKISIILNLFLLINVNDFFKAKNHNSMYKVGVRHIKCFCAVWPVLLILIRF